MGATDNQHHGRWLTGWQSIRVHNPCRSFILWHHFRCTQPRILERGDAIWGMQYIIRNTHENYTSLNNAFTQDSRLEPATIGILTVILTNKPDWVVYPEEIARRLNISRRTVDRHFKILEQCGYLLSVRISHGRGNGTEFRRFFSDSPMSESYKNYLKSNLTEELSTGN